jgi:hypothetical protein
MPRSPQDQSRRSAVTEQKPKTAESLILDDSKASQTLSQQERQSYEEAERSVVRARRKAETHEGLLQVL